MRTRPLPAGHAPTGGRRRAGRDDVRRAADARPVRAPAAHARGAGGAAADRRRRRRGGRRAHGGGAAGGGAGAVVRGAPEGRRRCRPGRRLLPRLPAVAPHGALPSDAALGVRVRGCAPAGPPAPRHTVAGGAAAAAAAAAAVAWPAPFSRVHACAAPRPGWPAASRVCAADGAAAGPQHSRRAERPPPDRCAGARALPAPAPPPQTASSRRRCLRSSCAASTATQPPASTSRRSWCVARARAPAAQPRQGTGRQPGGSPGLRISGRAGTLRVGLLRSPQPPGLALCMRARHDMRTNRRPPRRTRLLRS